MGLVIGLSLYTKDLYLVIVLNLILWISWNLVDFRWISWILPDFTWNLPDFTWNPPISYRFYMKSAESHEILYLWISWNTVDFNGILLDLMDFINPLKTLDFHEILLLLIKLVLDFMKSCEILLNFMKSCWFMKSSRFQFKSGGLQIMQILFRFTADIICKFQCELHYGFHYGFHLWILWMLYEIHLILYERLGESEESHFNHLFLLISGGFHVKSTGFHDERLLARNSNAYVFYDSTSCKWTLTSWGTTEDKVNFSFCMYLFHQIRTL